VSVLRECFSICFASVVTPCSDAFFYLHIIEKVPKSESPGQMRPGPGNSHHPRKEKKEPPCHRPSNLDLACPALCNSVLNVGRGGGRGPLTLQPLAHNLNVSLNFSKR
jgi:hypothetical protein